MATDNRIMEAIGKYVVEEVIGRGGMGAVYRAFDPVIDRRVAIKVVHAHTLGDTTARERFYKEARAAGRLAHENIITIHDVGEHDGVPYLVMELLEGSDLRRVLDASPTPPLHAKLDVALQICRGLRYAHQKGVVHRDIKPENVYVLNSGRVKILDFGIARLGQETSSLTQGSIGTPRYMSPEQVRGAPVDARSDIFSFGVLLYELLTGTNPFAGDNVTTIIYRILNEHPEPVRVEQEELAADLQRIVMGCLAKDAADRYPSCHELINDLSAIADAYPTVTMSDTVLLPRTVHIGQPTTAAASHSGGTPGTTSSPRPKPRLSPARRWLFAGLAAVCLAGVTYLALSATGNLIGTAVPDPSLATSSPEEPVDEQQAASTVLNDGPPVEQPPTGPLLEMEGTHLPDAEASTTGYRAQAARQRDLMQRARRAILPQREHPAVAELFAEAEQSRLSGQRAFEQDAPETAFARFRTAESGYRAAADAWGEARGEARQEAVAARSRMHAVWERLAPRRTEIGASFERPAGLRDEALQQFEAGDYEAAAGTFERAHALLGELDTRLGAADRVASEQREAADRARTDLRAAREAVPDDLRERPSYREGAGIAERGDQALTDGRYADAIAQYSEAEAVFSGMASASVLVHEAGRELADRLAEALVTQKWERLPPTAAAYYQSLLGEFFGSFHVTDVEVFLGEPVVEDTRAVLRISVNIQHRQKGRDLARPPFAHAADWIWTQREGAFELTSIE